MSKLSNYRLQQPSIAWAIFKDWFRRGKELWVLALTSVFIFSTMYFFPAKFLPYDFGTAIPTLADRIRWMGMLFQFVGVGIIVFSLRGNLRLFGENSMSKVFFDWVQHFRYVIFRKPPQSATVHMTAAASMGIAGGVAVLTTTASLEERVARLQKAIEELQKNISGLTINQKRTEREIKRQIEVEAEARIQSDSEIEKKLKTTTVGGVALQLSGVFYLIVGIMFTSIPDGTAFIFQKMGF